MPSFKNRKTSQKQSTPPLEPHSDRTLTKIKFNISMDNLRPFVQGANSSRQPRKRTGNSLIETEKQKKAMKTKQLNEQILSYSQKLRRQGKSPDIPRELSNQILKKIEANGIKFAWKDIEQVKSQCCEEQDWINKKVWSDTPQNYYHSKNHSFASTNDHFPIYYSQNYNYQMIDYEYCQKMKLFDQSYFIIDASNIGNDIRTTLMIKNIPNKYTIQFLAEEIDRQHANTYDFLYLPCDIKNNCNVGYGFINFVNLDVLTQFYSKFHNKRWGKFKSEKICNLTYARLQGLDSLIEHFQNSKVLNSKDKKYQPIIREFSKIDHLIKKQKSNSNNQA